MTVELSKSLAILALFILSSVIAQPEYCVEPVQINQTDSFAEDALSLSIHGQSANHPLLYSWKSVQNQQPHALYSWDLSEPGQLSGPVAVPGYEYFWPSPLASDPKNQIVLFDAWHFEGKYGDEYNPNIEAWTLPLLKSEDGSALELMDSITFPNSQVFHTAFWSDILNGLLISVLQIHPDNDVKDPSVTYYSGGKTFLFKEGVLEPLLDFPIDFANDLPTLNSLAVLSSHALWFIDKDGSPHEIRALKSGDDYNGWDGIYTLSDPDWIYIQGAQYDHALHLKKTSTAWQVKETIRFIDKEHPILEGINWVFFMRERLERERINKVLDRKSCGTYSHALASFIYTCPNKKNIHMLKENKQVKLSPSNLPLTSYIGDIPHLELALFHSEEAGRYYLFDGKHLEAVMGEVSQRGILHIATKTQRQFLSTLDGHLYELKQEEATFHLHDLGISGNLFSDFLETEDGQSVILFNHSNIYEIANQKTNLIYSTDTNKSIAITGFFTPLLISGWNGILFQQYATDTDYPSFYWITPCQN